MRQHIESYDSRRIHLMYVMALLLGLSGALTIYIASTFYSKAWGTDNVSIFYLIPHLINFGILLNFHRLIEKFGKSAMLLFLFIVQLVSLLALTIIGVSPGASVFLMAYLLVLALLWVNMDSLLEALSVDKKSGRIRGMYLTSMNAGLIAGPLISTNIIENYGYSWLFFSALLLNVLLFSIALIGLRGINHVVKKRLHTKQLIQLVKSRPDLRFIYWVSFTLDFYYATIIVYMPIHLLNIGMSWAQIGLVFSVILIPFVLVQYPIGRVADIRFGEKELIILALAIMAISSLLITSVESTQVLLWMALLGASRVGAALVEILRDSYFYKRVDGTNIGLINIYRTSRPVGYIIASMISVVVLIFMPVVTVFYILAGVVVLGFYPAFRLKDNASEKEMARSVNAN